MYLKDELLFDEDTTFIYQDKWIKESVQIVDDTVYNVYHGVGDSSLVKLLIKEEIVIDL